MTREIEVKVLETVDAGLVSGIGVAEPGCQWLDLAPLTP